MAGNEASEFESCQRIRHGEHRRAELLSNLSFGGECATHRPLGENGRGDAAEKCTGGEDGIVGGDPFNADPNASNYQLFELSGERETTFGLRDGSAKRSGGFNPLLCNELDSGERLGLR